MVKLFGWASLGKVKYGSEVLDDDFVVSTFEEVFPRNFDEEHTVTDDEIERSIDDHTKVVMIGTGDYGVLQVSKDAKNYCKRNKYQLVVKPTPDIILDYNKMVKARKKPNITAIVHVKC